MFREDGSVIHFTNPKVQASAAANTFSISGNAETKRIEEMLPGILSQLGVDNTRDMQKLVKGMADAEAMMKAPIEEEDEDVPALVGTFDAPSKEEA